MTKLLLKLFVKNYENNTDPGVRARVGKLSGLVGIVCNAILCLGKLFIGTISGSVSITADAMNNLSDAASSIVTLPSSGDILHSTKQLGKSFSSFFKAMASSMESLLCG